MPKYKKMTAEELAQYILTKEVGEVVHFATHFDEELEDCQLKESRLESWYGIQKVNFFDGEQIVVGHYGGGDEFIFDVENTEYFDESLKRYFKDFEICEKYVSVRMEVEDWRNNEFATQFVNQIKRQILGEQNVPTKEFPYGKTGVDMIDDMTRKRNG